MRSFSVETAGFVALTLTELLIQECLKKGILTECEVKNLLRAAGRRHIDAAEGDQEKIDLNMEAAHMIKTLTNGLAPLFQQASKTPDLNSKSAKRSKSTVAEEISATVDEQS